jgi:carboxymethylenebutenolidase
MSTVLVLHPWWGVSEAVLWWQRQLETAGHTVLVPDLYGGRVATSIEEAKALQQELDSEAAIATYRAVADGIEGPWVALGWSMGASFACALAGHGGGDPETMVLFYGGWHASGPDVGTRVVQLHVVPDDEYCEPEEVQAVLDDFPSVEVHTYEGSGHWFAEVGSPAYDEAATQVALGRVLALLT